MAQYLLSIVNRPNRSSVFAGSAVMLVMALLVWHLAIVGVNTLPIASASTGTHGIYSTSFPLTESPISEGGHWINGQAVGIDWANIRTIPGRAFGVESGTVKYDDSTALLTGTWGPNQTAQATVYTVNQNDNIYEEVELRLRSSPYGPESGSPGIRAGSSLQA